MDQTDTTISAQLNSRYGSPVIELMLGADDVARMRFASSPMEELVNSMEVLTGNRGAIVHHPWITTTRPLVQNIELDSLVALTCGSRFMADFLSPPIHLVPCGFETELEWVRSQSPEAIRSGIDQVRDGGTLPASLRKLYDSPETELGYLVDTLKAYWKAAIEPIWPRLYAVQQADISYRMGELASGGFVKVFENLHPEVQFTGDRLLIGKPHHTGRREAGAGLLLLPTVFAWPRLCVLYYEPFQPSLAYSPRGVGQVWAAAAAAEPLGELLGRNRAALLVHLDLPLTTSQLASYLDMSAAAVSQHLSVLRRTQLVTSRRSGRWVLYQRTALATQLLDAAGY